MLLGAALTALVFAVLAAPALARLQRFQTPSHRIACGYDTRARELRCDALFLNDVGFFLDRERKARRRRVTDTVASPRARVLHYGRSLDLGPITCTSRRTGLTCKSDSSRHGFALSRARQRVF